MKHPLTRFTLTLALASLLPLAAAAEMKIATINLQKVFEDYYKTKQATSQLQQDAAELDKEGKGLVESFKKQEAEYKKLLESAEDQAVSAEEREKRRKSADGKLTELRGLEQTIVQFQNQARSQINEKKLRMREKILGEIKEVINAKAKAGNYSLVLDVSGESLNNNAPLVIYATADNDLTSTVVTQMNATAPAGVLESLDKKADKK
jgi:outer membrane protein